jgi:hypothetical protein
MPSGYSSLVSRGANFVERRIGEVRRMLLPPTWVNKGKAKGRDCNYSLSPAFTYR